MIFLNYIKFKNGKLSRGEHCLWRNYHATYLGTYVENGHSIHMMRIDRMYSPVSGEPVIEEYIAQCEDKNEIVCKAQEIPVEKGQMQLC